MIGRLWRGWATPDEAGAYQEHLLQATLPALEAISGYRGAYVLRRDVVDEVEFVVVTLWDSIDAVRQFAGEEYELAVVPPAARAVLKRYDEHVLHYDVAIASA